MLLRQYSAWRNGPGEVKALCPNLRLWDNMDGRPWAGSHVSVSRSGALFSILFMRDWRKSQGFYERASWNLLDLYLLNSNPCESEVNFMIESVGLSCIVFKCEKFKKQRMVLQKSMLGEAFFFSATVVLWLLDCFGSKKVASAFATCCLYNFLNSFDCWYHSTTMQQFYQVIAVEYF